jgi:cell division protein FtsW (lipid II flippase)
MKKLIDMFNSYNTSKRLLVMLVILVLGIVMIYFGSLYEKQDLMYKGIRDMGYAITILAIITFLQSGIKKK